MRLVHSHTRRRGAIAPLVAILITLFFGLVAFALDLAWIVEVKGDLQNAADSAALAGAGQLMNGYVQYNLPGQSASVQNTILTNAETSATTYATNFAGYNAAGGVSSLTLNSGDVEFGFTDGQGNYTAQTANSGYPNTVKVTMRRDSSANGPLALFFAPVFGVSNTNLTATARSAIYAANLDSFQNVANLKIRMLPVTYDVNHWNNFIKTGADPDGNKNTDASGNPDLQVYPSVKFTGNFGLLGLDDGHAGTSEVNGWIANGLTQTEYQALVNAGQGSDTVLIPLSQHNSGILPGASKDGLGSWNWVGDTGMKTDVIHTLNNYVGQTFLLPLFKPLNDGSSDPSSYAAGNGNGSHYYYNIVQFVSVKLVSAADKAVVVEPSATVIDFSMAVFQNSPAPAGTGTSSSAGTFTAPKLTQ
jgi:Flp pilus assembly protein TadG